MFIDGQVDRIILSRPAVEAGEKLGYLPGDMKDKVDPYMQPLYDALNDFLPASKLAKLIEEKPSRSRRWPSCAAARCRMPSSSGRGAERHVNADEDVPDPSRAKARAWSSPVTAARSTCRAGHLWLARCRAAAETVEDISFNYFTAKDVVRHPLVAAIIEAYDKDAPQG
jgi:phosphate starvation-inducible PhoH-like protein